jgi:hypothetical protein
MSKSRLLSIGLVLPFMTVSVAFAGPRDFPVTPAVKSAPAAVDAYAQVGKTAAPSNNVQAAWPRYSGGPKGIATYSK